MYTSRQLNSGGEGRIKPRVRSDVSSRLFFGCGSFAPPRLQISCSPKTMAATGTSGGFHLTAVGRLGLA